MADVENDSAAANRAPGGGDAHKEESPDKPALKQKCKELETDLQASKSAILQLLEKCSSGEDLAALAVPLQPAASVVRRSNGSASTLLVS